MISPDAMLKASLQYLDDLKEIQRSAVFVGLPIEKASGKVYEARSGVALTVLEVGASHEYGIGLPRRSFLRMPFAVKARELSKGIAEQFKGILGGKTRAKTALGRVGAIARNIVMDAFRSGGFGQWQDITEMTKSEKGSSKILIDTGTLRNSITWVVRRAS